MSGTAEGGGSGRRDPSEGGGIQARRAGFDEQVGFPTVAPPRPNGGGAARAMMGSHQCNQRVDPGQWNPGVNRGTG